MAFNIGGFAIDHIVMGTFENGKDELVYTLSNLSEATISVTSESKDITNAQGNLVRRVFRSKTGEVNATSAFIELPLIASASGSELEVASQTAKITAPYIKTVGTDVRTITIDGVVDTSVKVIGIAGNGARIDTYTKDTAAADQTFSIADNVLTLPTKPTEGVVEYVIKCERNVENGLKVVNKGDKFPTAGKLTLMALAIDPCDKDGLVAVYIVCPNFQPSPDIEISLTNDGDSTLAYNGTLGVDQCSSDKRLYEVYLIDDED